MSSIDEKKMFSERLKKALIESQHPISPTYLANEFNHRFSGTPISVQAANNWLTSKAIPNQDKLSILAIWLNCPVQWLRFGENHLDQSANLNASNEELDYFLKFKKLNLKQQQLIKNLVDELLN